MTTYFKAASWSGGTKCANCNLDASEHENGACPGQNKTRIETPAQQQAKTVEVHLTNAPNGRRRLVAKGVVQSTGTAYYGEGLHHFCFDNNLQGSKVGHVTICISYAAIMDLAKWAEEHKPKELDKQAERS